MAKCENSSCDHEATHSVTLNIPAKGVPIDLYSPIKMYVGIVLCKDHAKTFGDSFKWEENEPMQDAIVQSLLATGRSQADFERSFHSIVSLDNPGYLQFLEMTSKRQKPV